MLYANGSSNPNWQADTNQLHGRTILKSLASLPTFPNEINSSKSALGFRDPSCKYIMV